MNSSRDEASGALAARISTRSRVAILLGALCLMLASPGEAQSARVPASVQAALIAKVAGFDRNFAARAGPRAVVIVVQASGDQESQRAAQDIRAALSEVPTVGNLPHEEQTVTYASAAALADLVRTKHAAVVYFGPGFSEQVTAIRDAFSSLSVLTFGSVPEYVPAGIVLGVDLVSGRPKLSVNVPQARRQQVSFSASVLNLMKIYP